MVRFGSYVVGEFVGVVTENGFASLHVKVGADTVERPGFTERMNVRLFDQNTGERVVPEGLDAGEVVAVLVSEKIFTTNDGRQFVAKTVRSVLRLADLVAASERV